MPKSVDLAYQRENLLTPAEVPQPPQPTRIILVKNGLSGGLVLPNGLAVNQCQLYQDTNSANTPGNSQGYWPTFGHNFVTTGTKYLFDVTTNTVIDLSAWDTNKLVVVWP